MNKERCERALNLLKDVIDSNFSKYGGLEKLALSREYSILKRLINEHFDNPPLKFEDLKEGMWIWDNRTKSYKKIKGFYIKEITNAKTKEKRNEPRVDFRWGDIVFEENRFYRYEVKEHE